MSGRKPHPLQGQWDAAWKNPGQPQSIGTSVVCDACSEDLSERDDVLGGILVGSSAYCQSCLDRPGMAAAADQDEREGFRVVRAAPDEPFYRFVHRMRGGDGTAAVSVHAVKGRRG